jgi:hypothetical protein
MIHATKFFGSSPGDSDLAGSCGILSVFVFQYLKKHKIESNLVWVGKCFHVWVETEGYLIDPSFSQFGKRDRILIIKKSSQKYKNTIHLFNEGNDKIYCSQNTKKALIGYNAFLRKNTLFREMI